MFTVKVYHECPDLLCHFIQAKISAAVNAAFKRKQQRKLAEEAANPEATRIAKEAKEAARQEKLAAKKAAQAAAAKERAAKSKWLSECDGTRLHLCCYWTPELSCQSSVK